MKRKTKSRIAFVVAGIFLIAAFALLFALHAMDQASSPSPAGEGREVALDGDGFPEVDWEYWQSVNPSIVGWVTVPDTNIDYPIVLAPADNPTYYLTHDIYKNYNIYGCPYLDAECAEDGIDSKNAVIFGHHMSSGCMFATFAKYSGQEFAKSHETILLQTPDSKRIMKVRFANVINAVTHGKRTSFEDEDDYKEWYKSELSIASAVLSKKVPDATTSFVTCSYSRFQNERTITYAAVDIAFKVD